MNSDTPALNKFHELLRMELIAQGKVKSCLTCDSFDNNIGKCELYQASPPPNTIVYGCEKWEFIPF